MKEMEILCYSFGPLIDRWIGWRLPEEVFVRAILPDIDLEEEADLNDTYASNWDKRLSVRIANAPKERTWEHGFYPFFCKCLNLAEKLGWEGDFREGPYVFVHSQAKDENFLEYITLGWKQDNNGILYLFSKSALDPDLWEESLEHVPASIGQQMQHPKNARRYNDPLSCFITWNPREYF